MDVTPREIRDAIDKLNDSLRLRPVDGFSLSEVERQIDENRHQLR